MATVIFDTHQFIKRMTDAGFTPTQAEALCDERIKLINNNLATKQDIESIKPDIERIKLDIEKYKVELELAISKGVEKHITWALTAVILLSVFMGLLMHFS